MPGWACEVKVGLLFSLLLVQPVWALTDPTRPPLHGSVAGVARAPDASTPAWALTAILVADGRRVAVINGMAVSAGDQVSGARVLRVEAAAVVLNRDGRNFELQLAQSIKIKSALPAGEGHK